MAIYLNNLYKCSERPGCSHNARLFGMSLLMFKLVSTIVCLCIGKITDFFKLTEAGSALAGLRFLIVVLGATNIPFVFIGLLCMSPTQRA